MADRWRVTGTDGSQKTEEIPGLLSPRTRTPSKGVSIRPTSPKKEGSDRAKGGGRNGGKLPKEGTGRKGKQVQTYDPATGEALPTDKEKARRRRWKNVPEEKPEQELSPEKPLQAIVTSRTQMNGVLNSGGGEGMTMPPESGGDDDGGGSEAFWLWMLIAIVTGITSVASIAVVISESSKDPDFDMVRGLSFAGCFVLISVAGSVSVFMNKRGR